MVLPSAIEFEDVNFLLSALLVGQLRYHCLALFDETKALKDCGEYGSVQRTTVVCTILRQIFRGLRFLERRAVIGVWAQ